MSRLTDYELFFSLMMGLSEEHAARTGHDGTQERWTTCQQCNRIYSIVRELELRQYDDASEVSR